MKLDLTDMLYALSFALEKAEMELLGIETGHGRRVACLSLFMAEQAGIKGEELRDYVGCCVLHDNALAEFIHEELSKSPMSEGVGTQSSDIINIDVVKHDGTHCKIGEENIRLVPFRTNVENIVLYHHENADGSGPFGKTADETGLKSQILHLADEVDIHTNLSGMTESEFNRLSEWVQSQSGKMFSEAAVKLFRDAVTYDKITYLANRGALASMQRELRTVTSEYSDEDIHSLAGMFARIIDYKSEFTQTHSLSVADKAEQMANYYGFDHEKTTRIYLAGALHDIGKLIVSNDILEKQGRLTDDEFSVMRDHASATRNILRRVKGIPDILKWASNHHEKLNGTGYPRGLSAKDLGFEERLLACIDIYQALTEKRPYKDGMPHEKAIAILKDMADKGEIDGTIVRDMETVMAPNPNGKAEEFAAQSEKAESDAKTEGDTEIKNDAEPGNEANIENNTNTESENDDVIMDKEENMTYEELVQKIKDIADVADASAIQEHVAFQFNIEGEAEGAFYLEVKDGKADVQPYEYYDRNVLITSSAATLLEIMDGKLDPVMAYTLHKIRVEGDLGKALLLKEVVGKKKEKKRAAKKEK